MEMIRINKEDADHLWYVLKLKDSPRADNNDEQFVGDNQYYQLYNYKNIVITAIFNIKDYNASMDSNDFCDWDNYDELYVCTELSCTDEA